MPGSPLPLLTWIVIVPIALAINNTSPRRSAFLFYVATTGGILSVIWWLMPAIIDFTQLNQYLAFLVLIVFSLILAIPYAVIGWLVAYKQWLNKPYGVLLFSACFVVVVTLFPTPLPGNHAHSLYEYPLFLQVLGLGGVPMILFVVVYVNLQIAQFIMKLGANRKLAGCELLKGMAMVALVSLYGAWQLEQYEHQDEQGQSLKIGIIQPKLLREDSLDRLYSMTEELVAQNPSVDLLVWPEFPTAFSYVGNRQDRMKVNKLIAKLNKPMVIVSGYIYERGVDPDNPLSRYFNTAHLIDQNRALKANYSKQILVPFFEYIPNEDAFPFLRKLFPDTHRYVPGNQTTLFHFDDHVRLIPLICYEVVFPSMTQDFIEKGGNIIINLTNDIWLGDTKGSIYHFAMGLFRTIEHRVPWVRATNSGISASVSAAGVINQESLTAVQSQDMRVYDVVIPAKRSFYSRYGDVFFVILVLIFLIGLFDKRLGYLTKKLDPRSSSKASD